MQLNPPTRRSVLSTTAAALLAPGALAQNKQPDPIRVGLIGAGVQGRNLLINCLRIPGVRFAAVCDIWDYSRNYAINILKKFDQQPAGYIDHRDMLDKQAANIDAVIVATPDWNHTQQTIDSLKAGKHVYCEKEMSNTVEGARSMVKAWRETGKLLQIGHQRRSNPRYHHAKKLVEIDQVCGRITHVYGQWNRHKRLELGWPKNQELSPELLARFGYDTMDRLRNWRWYKKFAGGPIADLGSHQIEVFSWFLKTLPSSVIAAGGADYYKDREWYDHIITIYDWHTPPPAGVVRGTYQILNTTSWGNAYETFMGDGGALTVSEDPRIGSFFREPEAKRKDWENEAETVPQLDRNAIQLKIGESLKADAAGQQELQSLMEQVNKQPHQLHLENFFEAVRANDPKKLTCPAETAFETCVSVLKANEALEAQKRLMFTPNEFQA